MWLANSTETVSRENLHANSTAERLVRTELEYATAEQQFNTAFQSLERYRNSHRSHQPFTVGGRLFLPLNPPSDPELARLEREKARAQQRRNELLAERASLRRDLGIR
jgi:hypothetical protein